jgi:hypothetical protein
VANVMMRSRRGLKQSNPLVAVLLSSLLITVACNAEGGLLGPEGETPEGGAETSPTVTQFPPTQAGLVEYNIEMIASFPAGPNTFEVTNEGTIDHNFRIVGQGVERMFDTNLSPGETRTMQVDLQAGAYEVYCPVGNHREQGMSISLTVTP